MSSEGHPPCNAKALLGLLEGCSVCTGSLNLNTYLAFCFSQCTSVCIKCPLRARSCKCYPSED
eukprot:4414951-Amphidinium_carterae.1